MLFTGAQPNNAETYCFPVNPATAGLKDYYFDLSLAPPSFWSFVKATGGDVRVTFSDRQTLVPRELKGFSVAGRVGGLYIANIPKNVLGAISPPGGGTGSANEVGMQWSSSVDGQVTEIRIYRNSITAALTARLWSGLGVLLTTVTMPASTIAGWQAVTLPVPVAISAGSTYVVSYTSLAPVQIEYFFNSAYSNPPLSAPIGAGVYGPAGTFPTNNYHNSNFFIDVGFVTSAYHGMPFYVHYGNPNIAEPVSALGGTAAVWEPSLALVAHLENASDSTQYANIIASATPPTYGTGVMVNGGIFDGSSNFLNINTKHFPYGNAPRSFAFWLKKHDTGLATQLMYGYVNANQMNCIYVNNTALNLAFNANDRVVGTVTLDTWQHWIITYDGSIATAYRNGGSVYSNPITPPATGGGSTNYIGLYYAPNWYMNGLMDELRVYGRCLSSLEVAAIYANQSAPGGFWTIGAVQPSGLIV